MSQCVDSVHPINVFTYLKQLPELTHSLKSIEEIKLTMFGAEDWKGIADLPEEIQEYEPDRPSQHDVHVLALGYWTHISTLEIIF